MRIVALIKPNSHILNEAYFFKKKVFKAYGSEIYLDHFPHITIFSIDIKKKFLKLKKKSKIKLYKIKKRDLVIKTKKRFFFKNDPLTKKITFAIFFYKNFTLNFIQKTLLKDFKQILIKKKKNNIPQRFKKNFSTYGYYFVDSAWKPHCTIVSVNKDKSKNKIFSKFLNIKKIIMEKFEYIYFYEYKNNQHKYLWKSKIICG